ncbi:TIGR03986 family CRISPR-associated RAMP protein [Gammaproteobacteria bacterium AB-CW1]|uniref:TIGR03986 family CRISPR-associated RAMP protein n=2 Tax=Natronospira TaxID=2024969 RepID=A0AAP6JI53_9GAMM|nr:TIGR03986 family CRISPR-associated RAMP protein [Gammaproteobacteria bacterium AB-CW1]
MSKQQGNNRLKHLDAAYNFVPLSDWVHIPDWGNQVSHDIPFQDGLSGEIHYELVADSPLLVGGEQEKSGNGPGKVRPVRDADGNYIIPGSSLKGMLRAVTEIAAFGRMRFVDDRMLGLRDISGNAVKGAYMGRLKGKIKSGWLQWDEASGRHQLIPCDFLPLHHRDLENWLGISTPIFAARETVADKFSNWEQYCHDNGKPGYEWELPFRRKEGLAVPDDNGPESGMPVFTMQISDSRDEKGKKRDFIFFNERAEDVVNLSPRDWQDFLRVHEGEPGLPDASKKDMAWPGYWREQYFAGQAMPVFYVESERGYRIGLAYMPKLAGDYGVQDAIGHVSGDHLSQPGVENGYDFADLLFGAVGEDPDDALKGRVSVETARAQGNVAEEAQSPTILNGPKPSYFPSYLQQPTDDSGERLSKGPWVEKLERILQEKNLGPQYITYLDSKNPPARVRGFKRYPARNEKTVGVQPLTAEQKKNTRVQVQLHTLPAGTRFQGRLVFHNLKPEELGALVWILEWGGDAKLRHSQGMGKPFGFGQVHFELNEKASQFRANQNPIQLHRLGPEQRAAWRRQFERTMLTACKEQGEDDWISTSRMKNLLAMADPEASEKWPGQLRHMCLDPDRRRNDFVAAKQARLVLADYARKTEYVPRIEAEGSTPAWLKRMLAEVQEKTGETNQKAVIRRRELAQAVDALEDPDRKRQAAEFIRELMRESFIWDGKLKGAAGEAREVYKRILDE